MDLLNALTISGTGLSAHRTKMKIIAENLANSETTRTEEGGPYRRKMVVLESAPIARDFAAVLRDRTRAPEGVEVSDIVQSSDDFRMVHNPSHPDADPQTGYVAMPNVNIVTEMADMIVARRAYDANVMAHTNTKSMISKALEIGK